MPSDTEVSDSDSSGLEPSFDVDPAIVRVSVPARTGCNTKCKEYVTLISRAAQDPSVIWSLGEEYEKRFWCCRIRKNTKVSCYVS